jgi:hypothetical protein
VKLIYRGRFHNDKKIKRLILSYRQIVRIYFPQTLANAFRQKWDDLIFPRHDYGASQIPYCNHKNHRGGLRSFVT